MTLIAFGLIVIYFAYFFWRKFDTKAEVNIFFWVNLFNHDFRESWCWKPEHKYQGWPITKDPGHVWYFNFKWLFFGFRVDNEY